MLAHGTDLVRIQADGGFVQNQKFRFMHQSIGQPDALAEAFGEFPDHAALDLTQIKLLNHILHPVAAGGSVQPLESGAKF